MEWVTVDNPVLIHQHHYDELGKTLEVRFTNGTRWVHSGVPRDLYDQMSTSEHPDAFWAMHVRQALDGNRKAYPVVKVVDK